MKDIKLNLTINEVNAVLKSLGNLPYVQVCALIEKIQAQANLQIAPQNGNGQHNAEPQNEVTVHNS
jgi:hypothetical protein